VDFAFFVVEIINKEQIAERQNLFPNFTEITKHDFLNKVLNCLSHCLTQPYLLAVFLIIKIQIFA